jgi:hypothetical protein
MARTQGAAFDKEFAQHIVMDHKKDTAEHKKGCEEERRRWLVRERLVASTREALADRSIAPEERG